MLEIYVIEYDNGLYDEDNETYIGDLFFETYDEAKKFLLVNFECKKSRGEEYFTEKFNGKSYQESAWIVKLKKHLL